MRKRRFVCGIALCLALSVAGCGKSSEEKQAAKYYQDELGLDKEEAESLAHEVYGKDDEDPGVPEGGSQETGIEPLPELVNSEWYERKVQIYDMVFAQDEFLTEDVIRKAVEGSAYDFEFKEGFDNNGEVCLEGIMLDGKDILSFYKVGPYEACTLAGYVGEDRYGIMNWAFFKHDSGIPVYDRIEMETEALDFKVRDDVLAYLAENGFVEVEAAQLPYARMRHSFDHRSILPDDPWAEFADMPHYYREGAQHITFYRVHKLYETDQAVSDGWSTRYSGCHLNICLYVSINFNTDGTIAEIYSGVTEPILILGEEIN